MSYTVCEQHAKKEAYGGLTKRKPAVPKSRKLPFLFPALSSFQRTGPSYLPEGGHASKEDFLMMGIRGVEFGQWMSDEDAQAALDHCYVAFCDLARLLAIERSDISLGGRLSLSFGARGRCGISSTGYDPEKQVIFFTKNNSAGFLAHEWCHALDNYLSQVCLFNRIESGAFISQYVKYEGLPQAIHHLLEVLLYQDVTITASEQEQILVREHQETMYRVQNQCKSLIESITLDNLTENQQKLWDMAVREIYCMPSQHSLVLLSKLRKDLTGHGISRNIQKTMQWNLQFFNQLEQMKIPPQKTIQEKITSFYYQHSWKMDQIFSKLAYGFYSDIQEMMARAFDCYIADKLKEEGKENRYLTAYSDSFAASGENGECILGFPVGKERKQINQAFDDAIEEMKSLGFLHQKNTLSKQFNYSKEIIHDKEEKTSIQKIKLIAAEKSSTAHAAIPHHFACPD